jgi:hypothetical protein
MLSGWVPRVTFRRLLYAVALLLVLRFAPSILWPSFLRNRSATPSSVAGNCEYFLGRELVVDDRGRVCLWDSANWNRTTGCCVTMPSVDECSSCNGTPFLCCDQYEKCVACCQQRGTAFKFCLQNCRFSSKNVEGIRFKGPRRFCTRG